MQNKFCSFHFYDICNSLFYFTRSSHQRCSKKKSVLKNSINFTGKHLYQSLFFNKVMGLKPATLSINKKALAKYVFLKVFVKLLRTRIVKNICERQLLLYKLYFFHFFFWTNLTLQNISHQIKHMVVCFIYP